MATVQLDHVVLCGCYRFCRFFILFCHVVLCVYEVCDRKYPDFVLAVAGLCGLWENNIP